VCHEPSWEQSGNRVPQWAAVSPDADGRGGPEFHLHCLGA
jgi:hypothetical protein